MRIYVDPFYATKSLS